MKWAKPKLLIKKILIYFSVISLIISIIALNIYFSWEEGSLNFYSLELEIKNPYTNKINKIRESIKSANSEEVKYEYYNQLLNELDGVSFLHKFYTTYVEANYYIIQHLIDQGKQKQAENIAKKWIEANPYDFSAKFKFAEILKKTNPLQLLVYYKNLYEKHKGMHLIVSKYVDELLEGGEFKSALQVINEAKNYQVNNAKLQFKLFFKDNQSKKFSLLNSYSLSRKDYILSKDTYNINVVNSVENLISIRLNIEGLKSYSSIISSHYSIETDNEKYQGLRIKSLSNIEQIINGELVVNGNSPAIEFDIPEELIGYTGKLTIKFSMNFGNNPNHQMNKILQHPDWSLSIINHVKESQDKPFRIYFQPYEDGFQYQSTTPLIQTELLIINFPSLINMEIIGFVVSLNDFDASQLTIVSYEDLTIDKNGVILITGEKPYVAYKLKENAFLQNLNIKFKL